MAWTLVVVVGVAGACAPDSASIADRRLDVTGVESAGEDLLPPGAYIQLVFDRRGTFDLNASGCHYMSGRYAVNEARLVVSDVEAVSVGCGQVHDDRDWWFAQFLRSSPSVETAGSSVLFSTSDTLVTMIDHAPPAIWELDPAFAVGPETRTLHLLVLETACASGQSPEGRILDPVIEYGADEIRIAIRIRARPDGTCLGNTPYRWAVELREPVGDRRLVDGSTRPPPGATPTPFASPR